MGFMGSDHIHAVRSGVEICGYVTTAVQNLMNPKKKEKAMKTTMV